jgi:hypothetical protein
MPPFQSPQTMIREDLVRIVLAGRQRESIKIWVLVRPPN